MCDELKVDYEPFVDNDGDQDTWWPCGCNHSWCFCNNLTRNGETCDECLIGDHG